MKWKVREGGDNGITEITKEKQTKNKSGHYWRSTPYIGICINFGRYYFGLIIACRTVIMFPFQKEFSISYTNAGSFFNDYNFIFIL